jgi:hypothetical protein
MFKIGLSVLALFVSAQALAFGANFTAAASNDAKAGKSKDSIGIVMYQPLIKGLGWWSWNGIGATYEDNQKAARWVQTTQGIDLAVKRIRIGATAKFQYDEPTKDVSSEYGVRVSVKIW